MNFSAIPNRKRKPRLRGGSKAKPGNLMMTSRTGQNRFSPVLPAMVLVILLHFFFSCSSTKKQGKEEEKPYIFQTTVAPDGIPLEIRFTKGASFNYPLMAIWIEDADSNYIATLYVAESIAKGTFDHAVPSGRKWLPGEVRRPAALPYWGHKRGIQARDGLYIPTPHNPMPDAITGPTPVSDFILQTQLPPDIPRKFRLLFEINQSWDWNEYWTNSKFPGDEDYKTSSQPAIIYEAAIDRSRLSGEIIMQPLGHSHYSGANGNLYKNLETLTTAKEIADSIIIHFP
ncbi:MAG: hypothetical protein R6T99_06280 [Bacteroidales bacterium]